ncbi:YaiO family outer membrane beta-barrel protein [Salinimicrobium xinjiangense]|uniref:YaiO family outer membrane beta-barrel protein n=1 Tax=Salinimicrobium xinjiangense TaxID=438596 RepID=UPI0003FBA4CD|nr:YaiO family outer membrane beta-barrel protein [Salinimicrobium xinjiangense]
MKKNLLFFLLIFSTLAAFTQEIDTDKMYFQALEEYRSGNYISSLDLTSKALAAAPEYHDIRMLQVRNRYALKRFEESDRDLEYLLSEAPHYVGVKNLAIQRLHQLEAQAALHYIDRLLYIYGQEPDLNILRARFLLNDNRPEEAGKLATEIYRNSSLSDGQRYILHQIINLTVKNSVQVTGQYISFSDDYPRNDAWYALSAEYQHNFSKMAIIGRATYSDRSYNDGSLYEIEAYPIFSKKFYGFGNVGFSNGEIFPDFRASASVFYNFAPSFEAEMGFRSMNYGGNHYFTGIGGLTTYAGRFYFNARAFIGPERLEKLIQNYQFNIRYYLSTPENYIFGRLGTGISPDEPTLYTRTQENPTLEAFYFNSGINKTVGIHHVIMLSGGMLFEDLPNDEEGQQFTASLGYRYKF